MNRALLMATLVVAVSGCGGDDETGTQIDKGGDNGGTPTHTADVVRPYDQDGNITGRDYGNSTDYDNGNSTGHDNGNNTGHDHGNIPSGYDPGRDADNEPGTWLDTSTGLTWENPGPGPYDVMDWPSAKSYCADLTLAGGGWRIPTIGELRSLIRGCAATEIGGSCKVTDSCLKSSCWNKPCDGCDSHKGPASGGCYWPKELSGNCFAYWSSSAVAGSSDDIFTVSFDEAFLARYSSDIYNVRCVR